MKKKLDDIITESKGKSDITDIDKSMLPKAGELFISNDRVALRMISLEEHDLYMDVSYECSAMNRGYARRMVKKLMRRIILL